MRVFCTHCGQANPGQARYCTACGTGLIHPADPIDPAPAAGESTATLAPAEVAALDETAGPGEQNLADQAAATLDALPVGTGLLVLTRGEGAGSRIVLDQPLTTAGRHPDADILLDHVTVSRRHAEFGRNGQAFTVLDVGSHNGTYVNGDRVERAILQSGDQIRIGAFNLVFLTRTHPSPAD